MVSLHIGSSDEEDHNGDGQGSSSAKKQKSQSTSLSGFDEENHSTNEESDSELPLSLFLTDPTLLQCFTCHKTLTIPVFQSNNGYMACSSCSLPTDNNRCEFMEKIIKFLNIPCINTKHGCKETLRFNEKHEHEKTCQHAQCLCPFEGCKVVTSSSEIVAHLRDQHSGSFVVFDYKKCFSIPFDVICKKNTSLTVLEEGCYGDLFALVTDVHPVGIAITVCRIVSNPLDQGQFCYEIRAGNIGESFMRIKSTTMSSIRSRNDRPFTNNFLLIPSRFFPSWPDHKLDLQIYMA